MDEISDETQSSDDTSVCCIVISSGVRVESSAISRILPPTSDIDVITNLSMYYHYRSFYQIRKSFKIPHQY